MVVSPSGVDMISIWLASGRGKSRPELVLCLAMHHARLLSRIKVHGCLLGHISEPHYERNLPSDRVAVTGIHGRVNVNTHPGQTQNLDKCESVEECVEKCVEKDTQFTYATRRTQDLPPS